MHVVMSANAAWNIWNFRRAVALSLIKDGHRVTVLAPRDETFADLQAMGCETVDLEMDVKGLNPVQDFKFMRRMRDHFRALKPDAVLSYTIKNNVFGAMAAQPLKLPFLPNVTGLGTAFLSSKLLQTLTETLYRRAFARLPVVFFQNSDDRDLFVTRRLVRPGQVRLLPGSGVDLNHFAPAPFPEDTAPLFLMISRLLRDKGVVEFVEAARQVRTRHPEARFAILGAVGAANRSALGQDQLDEWLGEGVIEHFGTTSDVRSFIAQAHAVVLPSYREGAPRTLIEAAAMARPVITTDVPGCRAVMEHEVTGWLCEVRSADSLAQACETLLALPACERAVIGQAGRAKMAAEFDQALVVGAYRKALDEVTQR